MGTSEMRKGKQTQFKCDICKAAIPSQEAILPHMEEKHAEDIDAFMSDALSGGGAGFPGMGMPGMGVAADYSSMDLEQLLFMHANISQMQSEARSSQGAGSGRSKKKKR